MFLSSEAAMLGDFLGASRVSSTVSNFKRECGISLETLQKERASSRDDGRTSWFFSSYGGILELRRGWGSLVGFSELQRDVWGFSRVTMGNSGSLLCGPKVVQSSFELRGEPGIALESRYGNRASRHVEGGISRSFLSCGRKPWVPSTCGGDLRELLRVPMGS